MAKAQKKPKTLHYLKADFDDLDGKQSETLESYLRKAYDELPYVDQRKVEFAGKTWFGNWFDEDRKGYFLFQFSAAVLGEDATVIPTDELSVEKMELRTAQAAEGNEFSDGDVICCVVNNDIFVCCSVLRVEAIPAYLLALFTEAQLDEHVASLQINRPANFEKIKVIKESGVHSIRLDAALDSPAFDRLDRVKKKGLLRTMIADLTQRDKKLVEAMRASRGQVKLQISIPKKGDVTQTNWANDVAEEILDGEDGYRIETNDGKIITQKDITISKKERLEPFGKSVFRTEAVNKLVEFKNEILNPQRRW
ncbi:hypothetical protein GO013_16125 [Pseudodesulfovibrio sp. JC047]|uniref:hypothetical protein n=1 Tax=Pseudodesulfovibrio sp. JC047 TaxID=2683199 RepID=UPI0013D0E412|nr:hypothetical protein [Pseudodesulfovibrio sp. JC047]NDV20939.1 hypothetical protein [Pseudodesulfovibrio sp. JC047]